MLKQGYKKKKQGYKIMIKFYMFTFNRINALNS